MAVFPRALREVPKEIQRLNNVPELPTAELTAEDAFSLNRILNLPPITPLVEAQLYKYYEDHGLTQGRIADLFGKYRSHLTNMISLLEMPIEVLEVLSDPGSGVTSSHAKALTGLKHRRQLILKLLKQIIDKRASAGQKNRLSS